MGGPMGNMGKPKGSLEELVPPEMARDVTGGQGVTDKVGGGGGLARPVHDAR